MSQLNRIIVDLEFIANRMVGGAARDAILRNVASLKAMAR